MENQFKKLPPFKFFVLQNFPFIEEDFDAITNYELLCKLAEYLKQTANATNQIGTEMTTLIDYVNNYFENLDVQEEINNKLDDMAESGELEEIIASYLNVNSVLAFDTLASLVASENLVEGSTVRTLGHTTYNDNGGEFYKIREITNQDVVDGINIVALTNFNNLIAERIKKYRKYVLIGDSYGQGYTPDGTVTQRRKSAKMSASVHSG